MKILVTGGCGFIGSNFIRYLLTDPEVNKEVDVINLDKLTYAGQGRNIEHMQLGKDERYRFVKADICNKIEVENIFSEERPDVVFNFAAESVSKNTYLPIWCNGKIKILTLEELFNKLARNKRNKVITKNGVEVINLNNTNYKALSYKGGIGYWMPINQISRHRYKGKIIKVFQKWGEIEVTPNHSVYDVDFNLTTPLANPELLGLRNINHVSKKEKYLNFGGRKLLALLRIFGAYVSEGWTVFNKKNGSFYFGVSNKDKRWIVRIKNDLKLLGYNPNITKTKTNLFQLIVSSKSLFNFIRKEAGFWSHNKYIPSFIFQLKRKYQEEFFDTLIFGDGEIIENKNYNTLRYTTVSKKIATGFGLLLTLFGYNYSVSLDKRFNAYTFKIGGDFTISLLTKKYEEIDYDDYVYDISVMKLKNFICGVGNIVVHNSHVDRSIESSEDFVRTNVLGAVNLFDVAIRYNINKVIQISTDEVYGSIKKGSFSEEAELNPSSPYATSKASAELFALAYFKTHKLPVIITRSANNYGRYQFPEKILPLFITNLIDGKKVPLMWSNENPGLNVRDWLNVEDNCRAIWFISQNGKEGEIYNIPGENERTNIDVTRLLLKKFNYREEMIEYVEHRKAHDFRYSINGDKLKNLGFQYRFKDLKSELENIIGWYKENEDWWRPLKK